jgi:hypothetical protein
VCQLRLQVVILPLSTGALQGNGRLRGEVHDQIDLPVRERLHSITSERDYSYNHLVHEQRRAQECSNPSRVHHSDNVRITLTIEFMGCQVRNMGW